MSKWLSIVLPILCLVTACQPNSGLDTPAELPRVVVTTPIIGSVVAEIGAEDIHLDVLMPPGSDPHDVIFRPADMALAARADVLIINGAGLEGNLDRLLSSVSHPDRIMALSDAMPLRESTCKEDHGHHHDHHHHHHGDADPHFWMDPHNVMIWADTIAEALSQARPDRSEAFVQRAADYQAALHELDEWITEQAAQIPSAQRVLVTDHKSMGYFAARYGFEQVGVIIPSFDTASQPAARGLAHLLDQIDAHQVPAIFVGESGNKTVAGQLARDAGVPLVVLPLESLTDSDGPAPDYLSYMRHNIGTMIQHLAAAN